MDDYMGTPMTQETSYIEQWETWKQEVHIFYPIHIP